MASSSAWIWATIAWMSLGVMVFSFLDQDLQDLQDFQDLCQAEFEYVILNAVKNLRFFASLRMTVLPDSETEILKIL